MDELKKLIYEYGDEMRIPREKHNVILFEIMLKILKKLKELENINKNG